jgi:two-component system sensor histidine kinase BaeS
MLRTLRRRFIRRFILSHVLPLLVLVPLMGIALVYALETRVLLPDLTEELRGNAALVADIASDDPQIWRDPARAQAALTRLGVNLRGRVMFLDSSGRLLASSDVADADRLAQATQFSDLSQMMDQEVSSQIRYSQRLRAEIVDVTAPVVGPDGRVQGVVRLSYPIAGVNQQFLHLRYVIAGVLLAGLLLGTLVGSVLALDLERPLRQLTQAVGRLGGGTLMEPLPEQGPREIRVLLGTFNTLVQQLRSMEKARSELLANLVHELGRPLGALRSAVQALLGGGDQDEVLRRDLLTGIDDELVRLGHLVDDLTSLHDQVLGQLELDMHSVDSRRWLTNVLGIWRAAARSKGLDWQEDVPPDLPTLEIDPDRLARALGNLLSNAIRYTPRDGTVWVSAGHESDMVWIRVSDNGPGIPLEEQECIFAPFYRSRSSRRFPQGLGLGLGIARDLVNAHGGRLELESAPGEGSRFTIWLPLAH